MYFEIMTECDAMIDLIINVGHNDLYFMSQLFYLITFMLYLTSVVFVLHFYALNISFFRRKSLSSRIKIRSLPMFS